MIIDLTELLGYQARMAAALERIAAAMEGHQTFTVEAAAPVYDAGEPTPLNDAAAPPPASDEAAERESIKAQLKAAGIEFSEKARTTTLRHMLAEWTGKQGEARQTTLDEAIERAKAEEQAAGATDPDADPVEAEEVETVNIGTPVSAATRDQVKEALVKLSAAKGKDVALKILHDTGKAERLSDVAEALYGAVYDACQKAMEG